MSNPKSSKKRKAAADDENYISKDGQDTSKPSAVYKPTKGRPHTLSVALPGSIIANALTPDQKTALAGQIARACAVFCVDEITVFDDGQVQARPPESDGYTAFTDPNFFLFHLLSYLETPPHLRKALFPMHPDLRTAGALPSLDMPHHMKSDEESVYRESVTKRPTKGKDGTPGTMVDCGLQRHVFVPLELEESVRVTVQVPRREKSHSTEPLECMAVSPDAPRTDSGYYWGYSTRQASSLSAVFTECPYDGGYDVSIGTSERGIPIASLADSTSEYYLEPTWQHLLIVFGGVAGLEVATNDDEQLRAAGVRAAAEVFDYWINLVPGQGSRTIRTEEAIWVGLACLRPHVEARNLLG